jgi:hypothetical protein
MPRHALGLCLLTFAIIASTACSPLIAPTVTQSVTQSLDVGPASALSVEIDAGSVTIERGRDGRVDVSATKSAAGQAALNSLFLDIGRDGDRVRVVFHRSADSTGGQSVTLRIGVPRATAVSVTTGAGAVDISGISGGANVRTGAGQISCRDATGTLDTVTSAGDVEVWGADGPVRANASAGAVKVEGKLSGDSRLSSGSGAVTVRLYPDAGLRITARGLAVRNDFGFEASSDGRAVTAQMGDGSRGSLDVTASAGRVELLKR